MTLLEGYEHLCLGVRGAGPCTRCDRRIIMRFTTPQSSHYCGYVQRWVQVAASIGTDREEKLT